MGDSKQERELQGGREAVTYTFRAFDQIDQGDPFSETGPQGKSFLAYAVVWGWFKVIC
jgi:hypothetical protein